jgi:hypothetical protein
MITSSTLENDNFQAFKNDNIYTMKRVTSCTLINDKIKEFKNNNIYTMENDNILYTRKL